MMPEWNTTLFQSLNNLTNYPIIAKITPFLADAPMFFVPVFLVIAWIYFTYRKPSTQGKEELLIIFYSCVVGILFALIIQQFIHLPRPETAISSSWKLLLDHLPDASFPSDHATVAAAFATSLWLLRYKTLFYIILPWFILMDISRIIVWVHWPLDIIVGTGVGIFASYLTCRWLANTKLVKKINLWIIHIASYLKL